MIKVLIVDSDRQAALDYGGYLGQFGYEVEHALDGEEGLEKVKKNKPDIIISEIELPKLDGISLLEALKKDGKTRDIPVLFLTKVEDIEKRADAARLGVTVYFVKSNTSKEVLVNWIKELAGTVGVAQGGKDKERVNILLVEDDPLMLNMYQKVFNYEGFKIEIAKDGEEGLEKAKSQRPNLILLDIMMPRLDGLDLLKKLKADSNLTNIPVVMLTNLSGVKYAKESLSLGAKEFLVKSEHDPKEVVEIVKKILSATG